MTALHASFTA